MTDNTLPIRQPGSTPEVDEILGLGKTGNTHKEEQSVHGKTVQHPGNLPVVESTARHTSAHSDTAAKPGGTHEEMETLEETRKDQPVILQILKATAPYFAVFVVGLGLYYFFLSKTDFTSLFSKIKPSGHVALTPKETALEGLMEDNLTAYQTWVAQYYFDVSDNSVIDPKADNSGNGLSNFQKFLLDLNPRSYDTLGLGMADSEAIAQGINPLTGGPLTGEQKDRIEKYFDMEVIMNRLTINHRNSTVAGSRVEVRSANTQASVQTISMGSGVFARGGSNQSVIVNNNSTATNVVNQNTVVQNNNQPNTVLGVSDVNTNTPGLLEIPSLNVSAPIVWSSNPKNFDKDLQSGVIHYPGTAMPGQVGTSYISGHSSNVAWAKGNYNNVFSKLGDLANNTSFSITVTLNNGKKAKQHYVVTRRAEYKATDQEQFKNAGVPTVALSTCWPVNTTQRRLVVFGELTQTEQ